MPLSVFPAEAQVSSDLLQGQGVFRPGRHAMWHKSSWRRLALAPPQSPQADDPQIGERLYQRSSHTFANLLGPTIDFPEPGDLEKGLGTPREFDFEGQRNSTTELPQYWETDFLEGTNKTL